MRKLAQIALLALVVVFLPQSVLADKARIIDTGSVRTANLLLVHFRVQGAFNEDVTEAVLSGMPTTFTYFIEVHRDVRRRLDKKLHAFEIRRTIQYDTLKQEFSITLREGERPVIVKSFEEAQEFMTHLQDVPVALISSLDPENRYYVMVKGELDPVKLPIILNYLLFFVSLWDFETPWCRIDIE